jgi:hypothetical protein
MKSKRAQQQIDNPIVAIIVLIFVFVLIGVIYQMFVCPKGEDCTIYKNQITDLSQNLSECLNQSRELIYVNQTIEIPVEIIKEIQTKQDPPATVILLILSLFSFLGLFLFLNFKLNFSLFKLKIEINLPEEIKQHLTRYQKAIIWIKRISLILSILIFIRLIWIFIKLF